MIRYLDTSLIVAALTNEAKTATVQTWLGKQKSRDLAISEWVITEFSAALSIKLRTGQIEPHHRAGALAGFAQLLEQSLEILPVAAPDFRAAARIADQTSLGLRAGDALHLAVAISQGAMLCTLDRRLADSCPVVGVGVLLL